MGHWGAGFQQQRGWKPHIHGARLSSKLLVITAKGRAGLSSSGLVWFKPLPMARGSNAWLFIGTPGRGSRGGRPAPWRGACELWDGSQSADTGSGRKRIAFCP